MFKENISDRESKFRVGLGTLLVGLGALGQSGALPLTDILPQALTSATLTVIGLVLVVEGYFNRCLLYRVLGINRREE